MKRSLTYLALLILLCASPSVSFAAGTPRENARLKAGKITKAEAQHLVLKRFPGSQINKCELRHGKDHSYFAVEFIKPRAKTATKVQVDGLTGAISP